MHTAEHVATIEWHSVQMARRVVHKDRLKEFLREWLSAERDTLKLLEIQIDGSTVVQHLLEGENVVVRKAQRFDFGEFSVLRKCGQRQAQLFERIVQHVHSIALAIVGLHATVFLDAHNLWAHKCRKNRVNVLKKKIVNPI